MIGPTPTAIPVEVQAYLSASDPVMATLIETLGTIEYNVDGDVWRSIVGAIVGQQVSVAAAASIRARVAAVGGAGFPSPERILRLSDEELRACGLSRPKIRYLRDAGRRWVDGEIRADELSTRSDEEIIEALCAIKGVGRWTAEMVLIFSLGRPDVLAVDDLGIRSGVQRAYGLPERPDRVELDRIGEAWRPYRSYASLYLWRSLKAQMR